MKAVETGVADIERMAAHALRATTSFYGRRKSQPESSPTFRVS
jgi:hypothetical protein